MTISVFRQGSVLAGGRFVLERRLGAGGMATVWLGSDERLRRPVAIKIPTEALLADPTFARRFEREAQTAASLSHPNLVSVYDYGGEDEQPYLVSEYIEGDSLERLRQRDAAPPAEVVARALLAALGHIHAAGIVHRDVKPGNVLVEPPDRVLLTDFGIAQSTEETRLTNTGHVVGTFDFIAPEIKRGERATPVSDLYSCGVVLRELLTDDDPDSVHRLAEELTADDPGDRPRDAAEALELLEAPPEEPSTSRMPIAPAPVPVPAAEPRSPESLLGRADPPTDPPTDERPVAPADRPSGGGPSRLALAGLAAIAALIVVAVVALGSGGGGEDGTTTDAGGGERRAEVETSTTSETVTTTATETAEAPAPPPEETSSEEVAAGTDPAEGAALNEEGYALLQSGDIEGALPKLEAAVAAFPEDSTDINYAYALFNYAQALRLSGDPAAAIPLLQKRLAISDFRVEDVEAELATAEAEASGKKPKKIK